MVLRQLGFLMLSLPSQLVEVMHLFCCLYQFILRMIFTFMILRLTSVGYIFEMFLSNISKHCD